MNNKLFSIALSIILGLCSTANAQLQKFDINKKARIGIRNEASERKSLLSKSEPKEVWFYEHANYQGKKYVLSTGKFTLSNLGASANDFFSSAIIPSNLKVKVFFDDNLGGKWIMLMPDELGKGNNIDFTNLSNYLCGKDRSMDVSGVINANDQISSIEIFAPAYDYIKIYDDCNYKGNFVSLMAAPTPGPNSPSMKSFIDNGFGNILFYNANNKAVVSSISLHGQVASVDLCVNENFRYESSLLGGGIKKNIQNNLDCLTKIEFVDPSRPDTKFTFNDRVRSIRINLKFGTKTIID